MLAPSLCHYKCDNSGSIKKKQWWTNRDVYEKGRRNNALSFRYQVKNLLPCLHAHSLKTSPWVPLKPHTAPLSCCEYFIGFYLNVELQSVPYDEYRTGGAFDSSHRMQYTVSESNGTVNHDKEYSNNLFHYFRHDKLQNLVMATNIQSTHAYLR